MALALAMRVGEIGASTPPTSRPRGSPCTPRGCRRCPGPADRAGRRGSRRPAICWRATGSENGRPPGSRLGSSRQIQRAAPLGPSRNPADPCPRALSQAGRLPTQRPGLRQPFAEQDDGSLGQSAGEAVEGVRCHRARCRRTAQARLSEPWDRNGAMDSTARPCRRTALRSRRKTIGASSSGSNPASNYRQVAVSRSA